MTTTLVKGQKVLVEFEAEVISGPDPDGDYALRTPRLINTHYSSQPTDTNYFSPKFIKALPVPAGIYFDPTGQQVVQRLEDGTYRGLSMHDEGMETFTFTRSVVLDPVAEGSLQALRAPEKPSGVKYYRDRDGDFWRSLTEGRVALFSRPWGDWSTLETDIRVEERNYGPLVEVQITDLPMAVRP